MSERQGDGAVPASDIDDVAGGRWPGPFHEEEARSRIDGGGGEHAAVGRERECDIRQGQRDLSRMRSDVGPGREVVARVAGVVGHAPVAFHVMAPLEIRLFGDPVLKQKAAEVTDVTDALVRLADDMLVTMYEAPGLGLAATQIGVQKRLFVYDIGDGPNTIVNPVVSDARGEWVYDEGCLSIPGLYFELVRPKEIHLTGYDLDGNEVSIEADELLARLFQHELDHLDGKLMLEMLDAEQRREALRELRRRAIEPVEPGTPKKRISLS